MAPPVRFVLARQREQRGDPEMAELRVVRVLRVSQPGSLQ
jgi:hypothetical protein